jgi:phosphoglycolate phosphatase
VIKAVFFDLDGTFADTAPDLGAALNHVRSLHDLPPLPLETIRPQASHGARGLLGLGFGIGPEDARFTPLREAFLDYYAAHICDHTRLFPGMAQLVESIERKGLPWGIVTNKPHRFTLPLMQALGYAEQAACLVSGDTCAYAKPHPLPLLHAAQLASTEPAHSLFLGDDLRDVQAGRAAGMQTAIARYGYIDPHADLADWQADTIIDNPAELIARLLA